MLDLGCGVGGVGPRVTSRRAWSALALFMVLAVASCSPDEEDPGTLPERTPTGTDSASPTPSQSGTPTESAPPTADATEALEAEITKFFEEYARTINESWTSEEALDRRREMFADSCVVCLRGYEFAERAHSEGLDFVGQLAELLEVRIDSLNEDSVTASVFISSPAAELVDGSGDVVRSFDEYERLHTVYQLRRADSSAWIIVSGETL